MNYGRSIAQQVGPHLLLCSVLALLKKFFEGDFVAVGELDDAAVFVAEFFEEMLHGVVVLVGVDLDAVDVFFLA